MRKLAVSIFTVGLILGLLVSHVGGSPQKVRAATQCGNSSLTGIYSYQIWDKFVDTRQGNPVITAYIVEGGLIAFDGRGGVTAISEGSFNGIQFGKENRTGVYSVSSDCMGSFTVDFHASDTCCTNHYDFVIVAGGRQLTIFQRDFGTVSAGTAIKQTAMDS